MLAEDCRVELKCKVEDRTSELFALIKGLGISGLRVWAYYEGSFNYQGIY